MLAVVFSLLKIDGHIEWGTILNEAPFLRGESNLGKFWLLFLNFATLWYLEIIH